MREDQLKNLLPINTASHPHRLLQFIKDTASNRAYSLPFTKDKCVPPLMMRSIDTTTCLELSKNNMKNYTYIVNHWSIDMTSGFITHQITQEQKRLGEYQLKLVSALLEHTGEILSREQLTQRVWQHRIIGNNSLPNAIHTLRAALGDKNKQQRIIQTIPKMGYRIAPAFCEIIGKRTEVKPNKPENEQTTATKVAVVEPGHHSQVSMSMPHTIMPPKSIFNGKRLFASLLLIIIVISGLRYLLLTWY